MKTVRCVPKQWARWNSSYFTPRRLALTTLRSCRSRSPRSWCTSSRDVSSSSNRGKHRIMTDLNNDDVRQRCAPKRASQQGADDKPTSSPYLQTPSGAVAPSQPSHTSSGRQQGKRFDPPSAEPASSLLRRYHLSYIYSFPSVALSFLVFPLLRTTTAPLFVYIHPNRTIDVFSLSLGKSTIQLTCTNSIDSLLPPPSSIIS